MLACGASVFAAYLSAEKRSSVFIYELPSGQFFQRVHGFHLGTIYDIDWSSDDKYIMSASNDCTAQVWPVIRDSKASAVVLPHPSFIYSCKFCPTNSFLILTAAFDGLIRLWSVRNCFEPSNIMSKEAELLREIDCLQGQVLNLVFSFTGLDRKLTLFSAGSNGTIILWRQKVTTNVSDDPSMWVAVSRVRIAELKNVPINCIQVCPTGTKLLLCCRDGILRMIDYQL